tara:strand:- start:596 stop:742 length:147 start_codon:yes stop_codon:yes gene_type:complete
MEDELDAAFPKRTVRRNPDQTIMVTRFLFFMVFIPFSLMFELMQLLRN